MSACSLQKLSRVSALCVGFLQADSSNASRHACALMSFSMREGMNAKNSDAQGTYCQPAFIEVPICIQKKLVSRSGVLGSLALARQKDERL